VKLLAKKTFFLSPLLYLAMSGCARLPMTGTLPPGTTVTRLASLGSNSPVAWDGTGSHIAYIRDGIMIVSATPGDVSRFADGNATALAWSPDDNRLAAAFPEGPQTRVAVFDRSGGIVGETRITGHVGRILWRRGGELLITVADLRAYSFGGNFALHLYRWNGTDKPLETTLVNTTLKRSTLPLWNGAYRFCADMEISPLQDEIAFARIIDPPMFPPYLRIVLHHLDTGAERDIAILPTASAVPVFTSDGEHLLAGDGTEKGRQIGVSGDHDLPELPLSATAISLSPGGTSRFIDGHLTVNSKLLVTFPPDARGYFSPTGNHLALAWRDTLYLVSGLPDDSTSPLRKSVSDRLLFLRKLRSQRLITDKDYLDQKKKVLNP